ncbi:MAG: hypothetical protein O2899_05620 [Bacteroidetes bacterium]|nr:hypothetical protein [Bacteroidota bacterium]
MPASPGPGGAVHRSRRDILSDVAPQTVIEALSPHLSEERCRRIERVLDGRTFDIACVVEGVANSGNVSAVMRTAEAFGFQPFHIVRGEAPLKYSRRTTKGAQKWLDVTRWETGVSTNRTRVYVP